MRDNYSKSKTDSLESVLCTIAQKYGISVIMNEATGCAYFLDLAPMLKDEHNLLRILYQCRGHEQLQQCMLCSPDDQLASIRRITNQMVSGYFVENKYAEYVCFAFYHALGGKLMASSFEESQQAHSSSKPSTRTSRKVKKKLLPIVTVVMPVVLVCVLFAFLFGDKQNNGIASNSNTASNDAFYSAGYPFVLVNDSVLISESRGISIIDNSGKTIVCEGRFGNGRFICGNKKTAYTVDSENYVIAVDLEKKEKVRLFSVSSKTEIVGATMGSLYLREPIEQSILDNVPEKYALYRCSLDGKTKNLIGKYGSILMHDGILLAATETDFSWEKRYTVLSSEAEVLIQDKPLTIAMVYNGSVYGYAYTDPVTYEKNWFKISTEHSCEQLQDTSIPNGVVASLEDATYWSEDASGTLYYDFGSENLYCVGVGAQSNVPYLFRVRSNGDISIEASIPDNCQSVYVIHNNTLIYLAKDMSVCTYSF